MVKHSVDIFLSAHVHAYERLHPMYDNELRFNFTSACSEKNCSIYHQPTAPVYVVDGTGGTNHYFPKDSGCNRKREEVRCL